MYSAYNELTFTMSGGNNLLPHVKLQVLFSVLLLKNNYFHLSFWMVFNNLYNLLI